MTPVFIEIFGQKGPHFMHHHNPIGPPISAKNIGLSLSHLVPEVLRPKFTKMYYLTVLKHFV